MARKGGRLTRRRRRDEFDVDGAECYTADSNQIFGHAFAEPAVHMTHNHFPVPADLAAIQRASRQIEDFMDEAEDDGNNWGFHNDFGDDGSAAFPPLSEPSDTSEGYDSDDGAVDVNGHPIHVQSFRHAPQARPRSHAATSVRRFAAWHRATITLFRAAYDTDPAPRFPSPPVIRCSCSAEAPEKRLITMHVYDVGKPAVIAGRTCSTHLVESLINTGLFPASPSAPRVAFTIRLLRLFQTLIDQVGMPANNMASTVQTLMRLEPTFQRAYSGLTAGDVLRRQLRSAVTWMTVVERYAHHLAITETQAWKPSRSSLADDDLHLTLGDLIESCPACFQAFAGPTRFASESLRSRSRHASTNLINPRVGPWPAPDAMIGSHNDEPQVIIAIDGNFTQKRRRRRDPVDAQPMPPRRFLSARQVAAAERAYHAASGNDPDKEACVANIRAIDNASAQTARTPFHVNGVMGACCRHDIPLILCDITTPGERHFYATALIGALLQAIPHLRHLGVAYDLGCRFDPSSRVRNLFGPSPKITWTVPLFHVYGHTYSCQLRYSPRNVTGFGLTDGEGMERVWSGLSNLITSTRGMAGGERRFSLEERCLHLSVERRVNLFKFIQSKRSKMKRIMDEVRTLFNTKYDAACVAPQFRPGYDGPHRPQNEDIDDWRPPTLFPDIPLSILSVVRHMAIERRRLLQMPTPSTTPSSTSGSTVTVVGLVSQSLLRVMAEIKLLRALMYDRPATTYRGTKTTVRLQLCLKNESTSAKKLMTRLNAALFSHFAALGEPAPVLEWTTLLEDRQFKLVEHWARSTNPSLDALPWWADPLTARFINAFEELLRVVEEDRRLEHERTSALAWIEDRCHHLDELRGTHSVYRDEHIRATALKNYWLGSAQPDDILFPCGMPIDLNPSSDDRANVSQDDVDVELEAQLARLAC